MLLAWIQVSVELAWMGLQWHECSVNCIDRSVADVPISMEAFLCGSRQALVLYLRYVEAGSKPGFGSYGEVFV